MYAIIEAQSRHTKNKLDIEHSPISRNSIKKLSMMKIYIVIQVSSLLEPHIYKLDKICRWLDFNNFILNV